jgi:N-acylethanolamine-hydrolysing acid amidase
VIHGRNLDFDFPEEMRAITYVANFYKNGVYLFDAVMFGGDIGIYTGYKANAFSLSENYRIMDHDFQSFLQNLEWIFTGHRQISWITREALTTCDNFECALSYLATTPIIAPGYLILAGIKKYEGAIISRDRVGAAHIEMLSNKTWALI